MRPVETEDCNFTYKLVGGTDENDLPCRRQDGKVTSFWEADAPETMTIVSDGHVVLWVWWLDMIGVDVTLTDVMGRSIEGRTGRIPIEAKPHGGDPRGWYYVFELDERERQAFRNGAKVQVTVDMMPPPPISVTPYEE